MSSGEKRPAEEPLNHSTKSLNLFHSLIQESAGDAYGAEGNAVNFALPERKQRKQGPVASTLEDLNVKRAQIHAQMRLLPPLPFSAVQQTLNISHIPPVSALKVDHAEFVSKIEHVYTHTLNEMSTCWTQLGVGIEVLKQMQFLEDEEKNAAKNMMHELDKKLRTVLLMKEAVVKDKQRIIDLRQTFKEISKATFHLQKIHELLEGKVLAGSCILNNVSQCSRATGL